MILSKQLEYNHCPWQYVCSVVLMCIYLLFEVHHGLSFVIPSAIYMYDSLNSVKLFGISNEHIHIDLRLKL